MTLPLSIRTVAFLPVAALAWLGGCVRDVSIGETDAGPPIEDPDAGAMPPPVDASRPDRVVIGAPVPVGRPSPASPDNPADHRSDVRCGESLCVYAWERRYSNLNEARFVFAVRVGLDGVPLDSEPIMLARDRGDILEPTDIRVVPLAEGRFAVFWLIEQVALRVSFLDADGTHSAPLHVENLDTTAGRFQVDGPFVDPSSGEVALRVVSLGPSGYDLRTFTVDPVAVSVEVLATRAVIDDIPRGELFAYSEEAHVLAVVEDPPIPGGDGVAVHLTSVRGALGLGADELSDQVLATPAEWLSLAVTPGFIYVMGAATPLRFDRSASTWSELPADPSAGTIPFSVCADGDRAIVLGVASDGSLDGAATFEDGGAAVAIGSGDTSLRIPQIACSGSGALAVGLEGETAILADGRFEERGRVVGPPRPLLSRGVRCADLRCDVAWSNMEMLYAHGAQPYLGLGASFVSLQREELRVVDGTPLPLETSQGETSWSLDDLLVVGADSGITARLLRGEAFTSETTLDRTAAPVVIDAIAVDSGYWVAVVVAAPGVAPQPLSVFRLDADGQVQGSFTDLAGTLWVDTWRAADGEAWLARLRRDEDGVAVDVGRLNADGFSPAVTVDYYRGCTFEGCFRLLGSATGARLIWLERDTGGSETSLVGVDLDLEGAAAGERRVLFREMGELLALDAVHTETGTAYSFVQIAVAGGAPTFELRAEWWDAPIHLGQVFATPGYYDADVTGAFTVTAMGSGWLLVSYTGEDLLYERQQAYVRALYLPPDLD